MTSDEFIDWAMRQPEGQHYELIAGEVFPTKAERLVHHRCKLRIALRLMAAVEVAGLPCEVFTDGMAVQVDEDTVYEPDAMLRCGDPLPDDCFKVTNPLVLVEVRSPSSGSLDAGLKFADYFRIASLRHYLIAETKRRVVIHHRRDEDGSVSTRLHGNGVVPLDPPGIVLEGLF